jgi:SAM-dependent methyltransferase
LQDKQNRLYNDLAHLWPLVSPPEDYAREARYWRRALRARLGPGRHQILELGVGGGHNLSHLSSQFEATAVDISPQMLALSKRLNPIVEHIAGDMRTVRLGRTFKAVLIHDAISYMLTEDDLRAAFATARAHLEPGGMFITAPDWFREEFKGPYVSHSTNQKDSVELTFIEYSHDPDPTDTTIESLFFYLLKEGGSLRIEQDRHVTGLFPRETWLRLLSGAGFEVEIQPYLKHEYGQEGCLLVGVAR